MHSLDRIQKHPSYTEQAYHALKNMIIRGHLEPGEVVSVLYLSDLLDIGRTPVTSACQKLESEGLVRIIPKQGILISPMTPNDVRELYEARLAIELFSADRAFDHIRDEDIEALDASLLRQHALLEAGDAYGFMEEDTFFHTCIHSRYPNKILANMLNNLTDRIFLFGIRNSSDPSRLKQSIESHEMMVKAIKTRDREMLLKEIELNQMSGYLYNAGVYNRTT